MQHCQTRVNKTKKYVNIVLYSAPNLKIPLEIAKIRRSKISQKWNFCLSKSKD